MQRKADGVSLGAVHTHTHTHTISLENKRVAKATLYCVANRLFMVLKKEVLEIACFLCVKIDKNAEFLVSFFLRGFLQKSKIKYTKLKQIKGKNLFELGGVA